jgi:hypothetical protein
MPPIRLYVATDCNPEKTQIASKIVSVNEGVCPANGIGMKNPIIETTANEIAQKTPELR